MITFPVAESSKIVTTTLDVEGMKCAGCVNAVERQLTQNSGVISACVNLVTKVAVIEYETDTITPETLAQKLTQRGFPAQVRSLANINTSKSVDTQQQSLVTQLIIAIVLLFFSGLGHLEHWGGPHIPILSNIWLHWGLATLALAFPGREIIVDGGRSLWHKMPNMNTLVGLGTLSAYLASCVALFFPKLGWECFFDEPVMLLGFILLGRILEGNARNRASTALKALLALQPPLARLVGQSDAPEGIKIPVEQVRLGEYIKVLPGEKIPVDGEVIAGQGTVDESMLTGESVPVTKQPGSKVSAGTINISSAITLETIAIGNQTTLAKIIAVVEEAQTRKAPVQKLVDVVAGYFAYGVMTIATLTFLFWYVWGTNIWPQVLMPVSSMNSHSMVMATSPLLLSLKLAIAVLVIACPCALGLATPTAILVGTGIGAQKGLLIKGGDILEKLHNLNTVVFDKTGTLTVGSPEVTDCIPFSLSSDHLLKLAATVESGANHPLGMAIIAAAQQQELTWLTATDFCTEPGLGVSALVTTETAEHEAPHQQSVFLGNAQWLEKQGVLISQEAEKKAHKLAQEGKSVVFIAQNQELVGLIALQDRVRPDALETITKLQSQGLEVILLTGDQPQAAQAIGQKLGINQVFAQIKPEQKASIIKALQAGIPVNQEGKIEQPFTPNSAHPIKKVAMVGDGINDAPALAQADVSISLHGGTDVAIETAEIVLMGDRLFNVVGAIELGVATLSKIRQNLVWALGYNAIAIPLAAGVLLPNFHLFLNPSVSGAFMASSSIMVVTNSLLLRSQFK